MNSFLRHSILLGAMSVLGAGGAAAAGLQWVPGTGTPAGAAVLIGGQEPGRQLPICRGEYNNGIHPGKVVAGKCNIGWGGKEILLTKFEVLTGPANAVQWVKTGGGKLPPAAFVGGKEAVVGTGQSRLLPICRAAYQNGLHPGKVVAGKCNIGWGGKEVVLPAFETMALVPAALAPVGIAPVGWAAKGDPRPADLAAMVAAMQAESQDAKLAPVKQQVLMLHRRNEQMMFAAEALKALKAGQPVTGKIGSGIEIGKASELAGVKLSGKADADRKALEAAIAKLQQNNQLEMARLQSALDKRNQTFELLTSLLKKMAEVQQATLRNLR